MRRLSPVMYVSFIFLFCLSSVAEVKTQSEWQKFYNGAKEAFTKKYEKFKKEGLSLKEGEDLLEKLSKASGKHIEGTGTEVLLNTLLKQAKNGNWIMEKKETLEQLIDFVGDVYAMSISDVPPDGVDAARGLQKGVLLSAKLAEKMPVLKIVAVPMIKAYAQAIENCIPHLEIVAKNRVYKNEVIELGYDSWPLDDLLFVTEMEEEEEYVPTKEELEWEAILKEERDRGEACAKQCEPEYLVYDEASNARYYALKSAQEAEMELDEAGIEADKKRYYYNYAVKGYKKYRQKYKKALEKYNKEMARVIRAKQEGDTEREKALKENLALYEERLIRWKGKLKIEFVSVTGVQKKYLEAKVDVSRAQEKYESLLAAYKEKDEDCQKAYATYNDCIKKCVEEAKKPECIAVIGNTLCVISKKIVYKPQDGDIADVVWKVTDMNGKPPKEGIEIPMNAKLSFADGSPVGRGEITYWGSKTEKDGLLIFHWNVSPDYRVVVKPANAEGSGATMTIEPQ